MKRYALLGLLLAACVLFPRVALQVAAPVGTTALRLAVQPYVWAFVAGVVVRSWLTRRLARRFR